MDRNMGHGGLIIDSIKRNAEEPVPMQLDTPYAAQGLLAYSPSSAVRCRRFLVLSSIVVSYIYHLV
jgi:hypothetical protein